MRPALIVHLIASNFLGGPERQLLGHMAVLDRSAFAPIAASFRDGEESNEFLQAAHSRGYVCWEVQTRGPFDRSPVRTLHRLLSEGDVALLCAHGYKAHVVGRMAVRGLGIPILPFVRGFTAENWRVCTYEWLDRQLLKRSPLVVTVSHALKQEMIGWGIRPSRIAVVHNAVDCSRATPARPDCSRARTRLSLGLPQNSPLIVSVGRLSPEKGHRYLVAAAQRIVQEMPSARVALVGDGVEAVRIRRQIDGLGLGGCVSLTGFRRDVLAILRAADVFVLPSLSEGLPNVVLEALAARVPTVATAVGGVPEVIRHEQTGLLVPSKDVELLARETLRLLREAHLGARLAREGRRLVEREFTFERQARKLETLYHACIQWRTDGLEELLSLGTHGTLHGQ